MVLFLHTFEIVGETSEDCSGSFEVVESKEEMFKDDEEKIIDQEMLDYSSIELQDQQNTESKKSDSSSSLQLQIKQSQSPIAIENAADCGK